MSRTPGERELVNLLMKLLGEVGYGELETGRYPLPDDPLGREVAWGFLPGRRTETVLLISHYDTVDIQDYGSAMDVATSPDKLVERFGKHGAHLDALAREHLNHPDEWLFGRGSVDMKSGVAVHLAVLEALCARAASGHRPDGSVLFICAPDEESESEGILAAVRLLSQMRDERGLRYLGAINTDYTSPLYAGDDVKAVYAGTVGKLLVGVYVRGIETHAGEPYAGFDANLLAAEIVRSISMRSDLADSTADRIGVPPVTLKLSDFKDRYGVQIPFDAHVYLNFLTFHLAPEQLLSRLKDIVQDKLSEVAARVAEDKLSWERALGASLTEDTPEVEVVSYAELLRRACEVSGVDVTREVLERVSIWLAAQGEDLRARSVAVTRELWSLAGVRGPGAVLFFAPPYYPHAGRDTSSPVTRAAEAVCRQYGAEFRDFFPYISDASYLSLYSSEGIDTLKANMPLWSDTPAESRYSLPLAEIARLGVSVVDIGVWGYGAHKADERVNIQYSCQTVPEMVLKTIQRAFEERE